MKISHILIIGGIIFIVGGIIWGCLKERKMFEGKISHLYYSEGDGGWSYGYNYDLRRQKEGRITLQYEEHFPENITKTVDITEEQLDELTKKVNDSEVLSRDGFNKDNTDVLDGSSRTLDITYENKNNMRAHGYESYPHNFSENKNIILSALSSLLKETDDEKEITNS